MIRFGLLGCGVVSESHIEAIQAVDGAALVAVASASPLRARAAATRLGVSWTSDAAALFGRDDLDAVAICTPSGLHGEHALAALGSGKHVVVEKPLALSVPVADAVIAEARRRGLLVSTIAQLRFAPAIEQVHARLASGALGQVRLAIGACLVHRPQAYYDSANWRGTRSLDGGVLMQQGIHLVDLMRWLAGPVASVSCHCATLGHAIEAEDTATVSVRFASRALGQLVATTCAEPGRPNELRLVGEHGQVRIVGEETVVWDLPGADPPQVDATLAQTTHTRQYADIVAAIRNGRQPAVGGEEGRNAVEIVAAAYEADRTGRAVALPPSSPGRTRGRT